MYAYWQYCTKKYICTSEQCDIFRSLSEKKKIKNIYRFELISFHLLFGLVVAALYELFF